MKPKKGKRDFSLPSTSEEKLSLKTKRDEKLTQDREREENVKYEKYISDLRQQNYRAALLADVLKSAEVMRREYKKLKRNESELHKWNEYVSCSKLPDINDPPAMHEFMYRWQNEIQDGIKTYFSWALAVNDKSMLTQDVSQKNQCYSILMKDKPNVTNQYITRIDQCLTLLNDLEYVIQTSRQPVSEIKNNLRTQLHDVLNQMTFRIITNVEHDMCRIDARTANFNFKSRYFSISIWTTRPVPQFSHHWLTDGVTEINFPAIDALVLVNNSMTDGFSYRCLLMDYDHFSDMAPSFNLKVKFPPTPNLRTSNDMEWKKREEIMREQLNQMKDDREKWELMEKTRIVKDEEEKNSKKDVKRPKDRKQRKPKPAPPLVTEKTVVDVTEDYLKFEEDVLQQQISSIGPASLNLADNEINLREFRILGGVYDFKCLIRPEQYNQLKFQFLYKVGTRSDLELADFVASTNEDLIEVDVKLSVNVNWWLTPIICYWQPWEESEEFLSLTPEMQDFHKNYKKYKTRLDNLLLTEPRKKINYNVLKCIMDFHLDMLPYDLDFVQLIREYIIPRIPITFKFPIELEGQKEKLRKEALRHKEVKMQKAETQQKRRASFDIHMQWYLGKVKADIAGTVYKMKIAHEEYCTQQRERLINMGENEMQINRFLKHKDVVNEEKIKEYEIEAMSKYSDYVEDQFKVRVLDVEAEDENIVLQDCANVSKTSPRDLHLNKLRQMPLKVIDIDIVHNFDVPNVNDAPGYEGDIDDHILLSTFLRYLNFLFEQAKPIFKHKPLYRIENENVSIVDIDPEAPVEVLTNELEKDAKSAKKSTEKQKTHGQLLKKLRSPKKAKSKSPEKVQSPEKTKSSRKAETPKKKKVKTSAKFKSNDGLSGVGTVPLLLEAIMEPSSSCIEKHLHLMQHFPGKWIRTGTNTPQFDIENRTIKFQISRFGTYGFAMPKYYNFPLNNWEIYPNLAKKHSVILNIVGKCCEIKIEINDDGFSIKALVPNNINFVPNETPMDFNNLKTFLQERGFNIFPDRDASIYIEGISEKHRSMEEHTYICIAQFALSHYFRLSSFNRLAERRVAIFELYEKFDNITVPDELTEILVTPQQCNTVVMSENITQATGERHIIYKLVPNNQEYFPDVYNFLKGTSNELSLRFHSQMKPVHRFNISRLLWAVRPLSFG